MRALTATHAHAPTRNSNSRSPSASATSPLAWRPAMADEDSFTANVGVAILADELND
jgi:hypothetical protein